MPAASKSSSRLNFRLPAEHKDAIERAAASLGQSVSDFAVSTLVQTARRIIQQSDATVLSDRDRDRFLAALDNVKARPNRALSKATQRYKRMVG